MDNQFQLLNQLRINPQIRDVLEQALIPWRFKNRIDILFVVDDISVQPGVGFGVGSVIELLRETTVGCHSFRVDIATRVGTIPTIIDNPAEFSPRFTGFRFDMEEDGVPVINRYEQVWCFGIRPNSNSTDDSIIDNESNFPTSETELRRLCSWMDERKGGLFGTGDHHILGASMCRKIPRLGTMRRWTNADGVPPIGTENRIDTLRPPSAAFEPGAPGGPQSLSNTPQQGDLTVQPIQWEPWKFRFTGRAFQKRPHPVLCHPSLGPINVMPDHAHEGLCFEEDEVNLEGQCTRVDGTLVPEYPDATDGGARPTPEVIAFGSTLGSPPYNFSKGAQPARAKFPMISVYDGHRAGIGRVATDSTWHHWMDINIDNIRDANTTDWQKIKRYFINLALWLNPPVSPVHCLYVNSLIAHFTFPGVEEFIANRNELELGKELRLHLTKVYGACWVTHIIWDLVWQYRPKPWEILNELKLPVSLGTIDETHFEEMILGGIVNQTLEPAAAIRAAVDAGKLDSGVKLELPETLCDQTLANAFNLLSKDLDVHLKGMNRVLKALK